MEAVGVSPQSLMDVGPQVNVSYDASSNRNGVNFTMRQGTYTAPLPGGLQYTYDAAGNRAQIVQGNAASTNLTYNTRNQMVQITVTSYTSDVNDRLTQEATQECINRASTSQEQHELSV